jgi:hypothetical protein
MKGTRKYQTKEKERHGEEQQQRKEKLDTHLRCTLHIRC